MEKKMSFSQFQKLGKVLMTPVMILPIAGILVGIGSAFTTYVWRADSSELYTPLTSIAVIAFSMFWSACLILLWNNVR